MEVESTGVLRKVALITGASYGIGAACAHLLARDGFDIVATELRVEALADTRRAVVAQGVAFQELELDLRDGEAAERVVRQAVECFGQIDVLVNNAGIPLTKPALDVAYEEFMEVMRINIAGGYFMAQQVARQLISMSRPGAIVNLASTFSILGVPNVSAYGISKAAVAGMTRHLAVEWADHGIRVNAVAPGAVETKLRKRAFEADLAFRNAYMAKVPMKRFGECDEVAEAVAYFAGDRSRYVTGHTMVIDGGLTIA